MSDDEGTGWVAAVLLSLGAVLVAGMIGGAGIQSCEDSSRQARTHQCELVGAEHHCLVNSARFSGPKDCWCEGLTGARLEYANTWGD